MNLSCLPGGLLLALAAFPQYLASLPTPLSLPSLLTFFGILCAVAVLDPETTSGEGDKLHPSSL